MRLASRSAELWISLSDNRKMQVQRARDLLGDLGGLSKIVTAIADHCTLPGLSCSWKAQASAELAQRDECEPTDYH